MSDRDIEFLKLKIKLYIVNEEYEKAAELKQWIIEMGGDPEIENVDVLIEERIKKHGK
jgi:protein-arginine kinase activator protein McsA